MPHLVHQLNIAHNFHEHCRFFLCKHMHFFIFFCLEICLFKEYSQMKEINILIIIFRTHFLNAADYSSSVEIVWKSTTDEEFLFFKVSHVRCKPLQTTRSHPQAQAFFAHFFQNNPEQLNGLLLV